MVNELNKLKDQVNNLNKICLAVSEQIAKTTRELNEINIDLLADINEVNDELTKWKIEQLKRLTN